MPLVSRGRRIAAGAAAAILAALGPAAAALAHDGDPRVEADSHRLVPGAPLTVRGYDFAYEASVELTLVGSSDPVPLGAVTADLEGAFVHTFEVPIDLSSGSYAVTASSGEHVVSTLPIAVGGAPLLENEDDTRLDEEDSLLAPMPSFSGEVAEPGQAAQITAQRGGGAGSQFPAAGVTVGIGVLLVGLVALAVDRRRNSA